MNRLSETEPTAAARASMPAARATMPGPRGHFLFGHAREIQEDVLGFLSGLQRDYGDAVAFRLGPLRACLLSHPDAIEEVLVTRQKNFRKWRPITSTGRMLFGRGLVASEGAHWLRQRRLMAPAFHKQRLASYAETMVSQTLRATEDWASGEQRALDEDFMGLTLDIVAKTLFDAEVGEQAQTIGEAFSVAQETLARRVKSGIPWPDWMPTPTVRRMRRAIEELDCHVYRYIEERRHRPGSDVLSMLLEARDADGAPMSDRDVRDEIVGLFLGGHDTTALALTWTFYLLARHPAALARVEAEVDEVLSGRPPGMADVSRLRECDRALRETLRLYPPGYVVGREAIADCEIGGFPLARGTTVMISPWVVQRLPQLFERPTEFLPERWSDGLSDRLPKCAYLPFGSGPRVCIGNTFATMESILILATLVQRFRIDVDPTHVATPSPDTALRMQNGLRAVVTRRS